jgi:hypothetical protein
MVLWLTVCCLSKKNSADLAFTQIQLVVIAYESHVYHYFTFGLLMF